MAGPATPLEAPAKQTPPPKGRKAKKSRAARPEPAKPRRRGRGMGLWIAALAVVIVGAGAGYAAMVYYRDAATAPTSPAGPPVPAVLGAGIEPPSAGDWPVRWAEFGRDEATKKMVSLAGIGFSFQVPESWDCTQISFSTDAARYACGTSIGTGAEVGGDLIVRDCTDPCDGRRRVDMRQAEEAWGLQWVRAGGYMAWAETTNFVGPARYGLVVIGYWRSVPDGPIDRQVVLRMTAPPDRADEIRKVANDVRVAVR
jgi:hypothetical protein